MVQTTKWKTTPHPHPRSCGRTEGRLHIVIRSSNDFEHPVGRVVTNATSISAQDAQGSGEDSGLLAVDQKQVV